MARVRCPDVCSHLKLPPPVLKLATLFLPVLDSLIRLALRTRVSTPFVYYHPGLLSSWLSCRLQAPSRDARWRTPTILDRPRSPALSAPSSLPRARERSASSSPYNSDQSREYLPRPAPPFSDPEGVDGNIHTNWLEF